MIAHSRKGNKTIDDLDVSGDDLLLSTWAEVIVCRKDYGKLWIIVEKGTLTGWTTNDKDLMVR